MFCYREDILHSTVTILHARVALQSRVRNLGNLCSWNPESWVLETGIQLKESGIPLTIGIQNPSSTDKYWNPVPGIRNPRCGIQNTRLSQIPLHRAICLVNGKPLKPPPHSPLGLPLPLGQSCLFLQSGCRKNKPHQTVVIGNFLTSLPDQWQQYANNVYLFWNMWSLSIKKCCVGHFNYP